MSILDEKIDRSFFKDSIEFVIDRPGHDFRYSINPEFIQKEIDGNLKIVSILILLKLLNGLENSIWSKEILKKPVIVAKDLG